jgi:putative ABC transport system permease protein
MDALLLDLRFALRSLTRHPGFALTAIVTLALGIGATTAIFSVVDAVILRPLPFERADRIVAIRNHWTKTGLRANSVSAPDFYDWKAQARSFQSMGYYTGGETSVTIGPSADYASVWRVTPGFFESLGAHAAIGRLLNGEEQKPGGPLAAILTDAFWRKQFNGNPAAIGLPLRYNDQVFTVTGVLPPDIRFPARADVYVPSWVRAETTSRSAHNYAVMARLRDGVTIDQARAEMDGISRQLAAAYPASNDSKLTDVVTLQELLVGASRDTLYTLLAAVALVLLIACANVANLMLSRATSREREMVVRAAVGAARPRLVRQLLTESAVLGILSALLGAWLARLGMLGLIALAPENLPRLDEVRVDLTALAFAIGISLVASLLFGLAPALQAARVQLADGIRQGGKGSAIGARGGWARNAFVVAEIALALALLAGAGLALRSFWRLQAVDPGFNHDGVLTLRMLLPFTTHPKISERAAFFRQVLERLRALPGVEAAGAVSRIPMAPGNNSGAMTGENSASGPNAPQVEVEMRWASPAYFQTMGIALLRGRDFNDADAEGTLPVAVVDESFARRFYPNEDPIGKRIKRGGPHSANPWKTIVGVVRSVRNQRLDATSLPQAYFPVFQEADEMYNLSFAVRASGGDPSALTQSVRAAVLAVDRNQPVFDVKPMRRIVADSIALRRLALLLLSVFAAVALALAAAGIYGVMAYAVEQRTHEIGVRMALGAQSGAILKLVIGQGMKLALIGVALGLVASVALTRTIKNLLFGVSATDPATFAAITLLLAAVALLACFVPARRAVRVNSMVALRGE